MNSVPENLPDDLQLLRQMLAKMQSRVGFLEEENALLRQRLFGRKSEQTADPATSQLALFNEAESIADVADEDTEEEVVDPPSAVASAIHYLPICSASKSFTNCPSMN
jgi:hypothetical protein